jgi:hypothetical protein
LTVLALAGRAPAEITLLGKASIPGDARDRSGLAGEFDVPRLGKVPHDRLGSFGSAIDALGRGDLYVCANDRGPGDGSADFRCRFQTFRITIDPAKAGAEGAVRVELVATTLLTDGEGRPLTGVATAFDAGDDGRSLRFDAEGVRVGAGGMRWVSDEYGPWVDGFDASGRRAVRLEVPAKFRVGVRSGDAHLEMPPHNLSGRQSNRGFEGLAVSPDGSTLWAVLQSPLIQDGGLNGKNKRVGRNLRVLELRTGGGTSRELVYAMESGTHGVNEALAIDDRSLLVLERDGTERKERALYRADLEGATDVSGVAALPSEGLPEGVRPLKKTKVLDFMDPRFGLAGASMPEKIEGLCWGPRLEDGRRTLIVTTDNDFKAEEPSWFWVFALDDADLRPAAAADANAAR